MMKPENYCFHTRNLTYSPLSLRDSDKLHNLWTSEALCESLWGDDIISKEQSKTIINESKKLFRKEKLGLWSVKLKKTNLLLGFGGLWYLYEPPERQLIFAVDKRFRGDGYGTEIARAIVHFGFKYCNMPEIIGSNSSNNIAASRVLQKAGMLYNKQVLHNRVKTNYYEIPKSRWSRDRSLEFAFSNESSAQAS